MPRTAWSKSGAPTWILCELTRPSRKRAVAVVMSDQTARDKMIDEVIEADVELPSTSV